LYFGGGDSYIPYKKNIFLLKHSDDTYEPYFTEQSRTFAFGDIIIKQILQNSKYIHINMISNIVADNINPDKKFQEIEEDLTKYIGKKRPPKKINVESEIIDKNKSSSYDDSMNAYNEDDTENNIGEKKKKNDMSHWKILNISDNDMSDNDVEISISKKSSDKSKCEYKLSDIKSTLKIADLQNIAKKLKISLENGGKSKTKNDLFFEIKTKISKSSKKK
jgi:hypothetical protein